MLNDLKNILAIPNIPFRLPILFPHWPMPLRLDFVFQYKQDLLYVSNKTRESLNKLRWKWQALVISWLAVLVEIASMGFKKKKQKVKSIGHDDDYALFTFYSYVGAKEKRPTWDGLKKEILITQKGKASRKYFKCITGRPAFIKNIRPDMVGLNLIANGKKISQENLCRSHVDVTINLNRFQQHVVFFRFGIKRNTFHSALHPAAGW